MPTTRKPTAKPPKVKPPRAPGRKPKRAELRAVAVPGEDDLARVSAALGEADRKVFATLLDRLTVESGSREVARLWLVTPSPEFATVPLDEVRNGRAAALLAFVESRFGGAPPNA